MPASLGPKPPPRGEDLPYDDGEPMETKRHRQQMNLLVDSLADHWRGRDEQRLREAEERARVAEAARSRD